MEFSWLVSRKEPLWWESNNGVFHNFTPTLKDYLKQQKRFAIDAIPMMFNQKKMLTTEIPIIPESSISKSSSLALFYPVYYHDMDPNHPHL